MAIYAIGDVQGCYDDLLRLLDFIQFDANKDQLWFAGDLVNRGPKSLETLRLVKSLGTSAVTVLGNHDLHLLAAANTPITASTKTALQQVLLAADRDELIDWLRHRPFFHHDDHFCLVHAGLPKQWNLTQVLAMTRIAEEALQSDQYPRVLSAMYGDKPDLWSTRLTGMAKLRFIINSFTRMRYCDADGRLDLTFNGPPGSQPEKLIPWFKVPGRKTTDLKIIFGHWSSLGYYQGENCYAIDTGCLWGGQLTAIKLGDQVERYSIDCAAKKSRRSGMNKITNTK